MILEAIAIVGGALTAITCSSLWLVSVLDKRDRAEEEPAVQPAQEKVRPYHGANGDCALCGQTQQYLTVKAEGQNLRYVSEVRGKVPHQTEGVMTEHELEMTVHYIVAFIIVDTAFGAVLVWALFKLADRIHRLEVGDDDDEES